MVKTDPPLKSTGHALFLLHLTLFVWWGFRQAFARIAPRLGIAEPTLAFDLFSLGLIVTTLFVIARFSRALKGTGAESVARLAVFFAIVDVIGQSLQVAPELGLPALLPADQSLAELGVRGSWVTCEFALRGATFAALWRIQRGAAASLAPIFFGLLGLQWALVLLSFTGSTTSYADTVNALPGWWLARRAATWLSFSWLSILVGLSRRVARG